ncbi:MAG TPA: FtsQ-type POTRA domain-containing protein [Vicinamibacterales bacterium]
MPVPAPADKRFRRVHVSPARRRSWRDVWPRRTLRAAVVLALAGYATYRAAGFVLSAEALTVTRITVSGNTRLSRGEVLSLLDGLHGKNMVTVDLEDWRERLLVSPWVSNAAMRRVLPGTVDVFIAERQPMGIGRIGPSLYLIDQRGDVIDEFGPNYADLDLPIIDGLAAGPRENGLLIDDARAALAGRLLTALQAKPELAGRVSQVDVSDARDAVVILKDDTALVRIGDDQFVERLQSYLELAPALRERVPNIDSVDLRFDERVYVRPQGTGPRPRKTRRGGT